MKLISVIAAGAAILFAAAGPPAAAQERVSLPRFNSIELNGGGELRLRHGAEQRVTILRGSTEFTELKVDRDGKLVIDACNQRCPRRYDLEVEVVTPAFEAVAVNGGGIIIAGDFPRQGKVAAAVHGGGEVNLAALPVRNIAAAVHGGGTLIVRPEANLAAAVNGGGEIRYIGSPQVATSINGGGNVVKER